MVLTALSNEALLTGLEAACGDSRLLLGRMVRYLIEVEERRLHLEIACPSMFVFCVRRLGMSEGAAFRRTNAARLVRRIPSLLARIERGDVHMSTLALLRKHLTPANVDELVEATKGKRKSEVEELLARLRPRPDVPSTIRKLPAATTARSQTSTNVPPVRVPAHVPARIEPLSPARYRLQLTASAELRDKLERATELMRHRNPAGDLAVVVERALDALLAKLERETRASKALSHREAAPRAAKPGHVRRAVRREVFARDGEQCTFADPQGRRCPSRSFLELDHRESRALGGSSDAANLRVYCRQHNLLHAEQVFGRAYVARRIHFRQRKPPPPPLDGSAEPP